MSVDRMQLNAALHNLKKGEDPEGISAAIVIQAFHATEIQGYISIEINSLKRGEDIDGYAPGIGQAKIPGPVESKTRKYGIKESRIGDFRVWKADKRSIYFMDYRSFHNSRIGDMDSKKEEAFVLLYDYGTGRPIKLMRMHFTEKSFKIPFLPIGFSFLTPKYEMIIHW